MFIAAQQEIVYPIQMSEFRNTLAQFSYQNRSALQKFDKLASVLQKELSQEDYEIILVAAAFAAEKHQHQIRKDAEATPYIIHPIGVCLSLWQEGGVRDVNTLLAALLHDILEDTDATKEEIVTRFGIHVAEIVEELTNPNNLSTEETKAWQIHHASTLSFEAKLVKLADRLYNVRDLSPAPVGWSQEKIEAYYGWGQKLLNALRGTNSHLEALLQDVIDKR